MPKTWGAAVHDRNVDQVDYWNGPAGQRWVDRQQIQDAVLAPIADVLFDRARATRGAWTSAAAAEQRRSSSRVV